MSPDAWFHLAEIAVLILGIALPSWSRDRRLKNLMSDFPPHRHLMGKIIFPKGYEPTEVESNGGH